MKRILAIANGVFAAVFLLAPAVILAAPAPSNRGIVAVDSNYVGSAAEVDRPLTSDAAYTFIHGFNVLDSEGTWAVEDGSKSLASGTWTAHKAASGNGFDFTAGPIDIPAGSHTVKVFDSSGLSPEQASKTFTSSSDPVDKGPFADDNAGTIKLHPIGPCPDANAEQLNHGAPPCDPSGYEPADEASQNAEIGTRENVTPRHVPHLPCENIEVLGRGLADESGNYEIDSWPPTGHKEPVYGKDTSGTSVLTAGMTPGDVGNNGHSVYNSAVGGLQVMDIIDVDALVHNAVVAGAQPHPIQGYHFKVQFNQGIDQAGNSHKEQKHKTFSVNCPAPGQPGPTPTPTPTSSPTPTPVPTPTSTPTPTPTPVPSPSPGDLPCIENVFSGMTPAAGSSVAPGGTISAVYTDETGLNTVAPYQVVFTITDAAGHMTNLTPAIDFTTGGPGIKGRTVATISAVVPTLATGGYTVLLKAYDTDQNKGAGGQDCGSATWPVTVTPPPPPPPASVLSIVKHVDHAQVVAPASLTYTIDVTNSGNAAANNVGIVDVIKPGTVHFDGPVSFFPTSGSVHNSDGTYIWTIPSIAPGATAQLVFTIVVRTAGTIDNASSIGVPTTTCTAPTCSQVETVVTVPPALARITAVIYKEGTRQVVPGGTVQLQGVTQPNSSYPATYGNLPAGNYCVQETNPSGWNLVGTNLPMTGTPGQVCTPVQSGQTVHVIYYVSQPAVPTACVGEEYMLEGTTIVVPGGTVDLTGQANQAAPFTYCNLPVGSVTGTAVTPPAGYTLVPGTSPKAEVLHAGNNPTIIFYVNLPQGQPGCGELLGTIVLAGTNTMIPGGAITESGQPAVTTYPALLGPCLPGGQVPVTATVPPGYVFVGPGSTTATITPGQVTPVVFQVTPLAGGVQGVTTTTPTVQHAPVSGVLGTSAGMPLTGNEAAQRIALSLACVTIGMVMLAFTMRGRRAQ